MKLDDREIIILTSFLESWINDDMKLSGRISYQDVIDLLNKFGVDSSPIEKKLNSYAESTRIR